jgi:hypothetical protein
MKPADASAYRQLGFRRLASVVSTWPSIRVQVGGSQSCCTSTAPTNAACSQAIAALLFTGSALGGVWDGISPCVSDNEKTATSSVKVNFYSFNLNNNNKFSGLSALQQPVQGADCPVRCDDSNFADTMYLSTLGGSVCNLCPVCAC